MTTASRPSASAASRKSGVSGERIVACVSRPERPRFTAAPICRPVAAGCRPASGRREFQCRRDAFDIEGLAALNGDVERAAFPGKAHIVDAKSRGDEILRHDDRAPFARGHQHAHALADEVAEVILWLPNPRSRGHCEFRDRFHGCARRSAGRRRRRPRRPDAPHRLASGPAPRVRALRCARPDRSRPRRRRRRPPSPPRPPGPMRARLCPRQAPGLCPALLAR